MQSIGLCVKSAEDFINSLEMKYQNIKEATMLAEMALREGDKSSHRLTVIYALIHAM